MSALSGIASVVEVADPFAATSQGDGVDLAIVDMQVGTMGSMAITRGLKSTPSFDGAIIILLDREADAFIAKRAGADAWLTKPFSAQALRAKLSEVSSLRAVR